MKIKSLELLGFKSFPDRTVLNFNDGATIVVGPNGSGKSNISDAIRWVLGETSAKGVRGSKMEDVIFAGAASRRAMTTAEVSLILDNTEEEGKLVDRGDEIIVTRRCVRGGESEYLIDRKPARLRDITELFMNTGVGRSGYSIIGQGKIAEIVSQKSDERRTIFEDAAGISKYRFRKNEAERHLQGAVDNMVRAEDILRELEARVAPLQRDAEKAKRYLELFEEKKRLDVSLWLYDVEDVRRKVGSLGDETAAAKRMLDEADGELEALEARNERLFDEAQQTKQRAAEAQKNLRDNSAASLELEGSVKVLHNELEHIGERRAEAESTLTLRRAALEEANGSGAELLSRLEEQTAALEVLRAEHAELDGSAEQLKSQRVENETRESELERQLREMENGAVERRLRLSEISGSHESRELRLAEIEECIEEILERGKLLGDRLERSERTVADYTARREQTGAEADGLEKRLGELSAETEELRTEQVRIGSELAAKKQRADTLRRMEEHFEGYNGSVRFVMDAVGRGRLGGVLGPVSRLITVPDKYSTAIETALGANIQNIVVEDEATAKRAIAMLRDGGAGRATFYPVSSVRAQQLNIDKSRLSSYKGYIGIASELIECDERCGDVISYMLGRTIIFRDLDCATDYARASGYRVKIVTLDGQVINAGGSFTGGSNKRNSGMLTRAQEIQRFAEEAAALEVKLRAASDREKKIAEESAELRDRLGELKQNLSVLDTMLGAENTQNALLRSQIDADKESLIGQREALEALGAESKRDDDECEALRRELSESETAAQRCREMLASTAEEHERLNRDIARALDRVSAQLIRINSAEKDIEATENSISLGQATVTRLSEQIAEAEAAIAACNEKEEEVRARLAAADTDLDGLRGRAAELESEHSALIDEGLRSDASLSRLREQIKEENHRRETLFRTYTELESKFESAKAEQDKLASRLWEEYELTYATAAALDYPRVTEETRTASAARQTELRSKIRALGPVNVGAIDEYKEVSERAGFMRSQYDDLCRSKQELEEIITGLEKEMRERFVSVMEQLDSGFKRTFRELFGGGTAELCLTDPTDPLGCGIEINVAPPGKIVKSMSLLSGGEQSFVAIALFFAILDVNPTPFAVLDEIEAALDDVNVARFADYIKRYSGSTQFVVITHRRGTMEIADTLYGVTMPERGISRVLTLNITEVEDRLGVKIK